jgi:hypothetical protein
VSGENSTCWSPLFLISPSSRRIAAPLSSLIFSLMVDLPSRKSSPLTVMSFPSGVNAKACVSTAIVTVLGLPSAGTEFPAVEVAGAAGMADGGAGSSCALAVAAGGAAAIFCGCSAMIFAAASLRWGLVGNCSTKRRSCSASLVSLRKLQAVSSGDVEAAGAASAAAGAAK